MHACLGLPDWLHSAFVHACMRGWPQCMQRCKGRVWGGWPARMESAAVRRDRPSGWRSTVGCCHRTRQAACAVHAFGRTCNKGHCGTAVSCGCPPTNPPVINPHVTSSNQPACNPPPVSTRLPVTSPPEVVGEVAAAVAARAGAATVRGRLPQVLRTSEQKREQRGHTGQSGCAAKSGQAAPEGLQRVVGKRAGGECADNIMQKKICMNKLCIHHTQAA